MQSITKFNINRHHIHLECLLTNHQGIDFAFDAILDSGAPTTEFSGTFLKYVGFIDKENQDIKIKPGLQTQKYNKIVLPNLKICGKVLDNFKVHVSKFENSWGIDALIGLDFFRQFEVTISYHQGIIIVKPLWACRRNGHLK